MQKKNMLRDLNEKLIDYFDANVPQILIHPKDWMLYAAKSLVGTHESGYNAGYLVELMQDTIGKAERESWCMSAVQSCVAYAEYKTGIKSTLFHTEHCMTAFNNHPKELILEKPERGSVAIWRYGEGPNGHCGIFESMFNDKLMVTYEGNTSATNKEINREGDVFDKKIRTMRDMGSMKLMGFLKVFNV